MIQLPGQMQAWGRKLPLARSLEGYGRGDLRTDLFAGLTVGVVLIPQGMAYALIAGLPPVYGIYTAIIIVASSLRHFCEISWLVCSGTHKSRDCQCYPNRRQSPLRSL